MEETGALTMRVVRTQTLESSELCEVPMPRASLGDALVRVQACNIGPPALLSLELERGGPIVLGRGPVGFVIEAGPATVGVEVGDRVYVSYHVPYRAERAGSPNNVKNPTLHRWTSIDPGGFAEVVRVPAEHLHHGAVLRLPRELGTFDACFLEPLGAMLEALAAHELVAGEVAAVSGLDVRGLLAVQLLLRAGARVYAIDESPRRRAIAEALGATPVDGVSAEALSRATAGEAISHGLFAGGPAQALGAMAACLGVRGMLSVAGLTGDDGAWPFNPRRLFKVMGTLRAVHGVSDASLAEALRLVESRALDLNALPVRLLRLEDVAAALRDSLHDPSWIGAVVLPNGGLRA